MFFFVVFRRRRQRRSIIIQVHSYYVLFAILFDFFLFVQVRSWRDSCIYVCVHLTGAYFISLVVNTVDQNASKWYFWMQVFIPAIAITIIYFYDGNFARLLYRPIRRAVNTYFAQAHASRYEENTSNGEELINILERETEN